VSTSSFSFIGEYPMDYLEKRTSAYKDLAVSGVTCGTLYADRNTDTGWTLEFKWASHVERSTAKELITNFLTVQYEAFGMSFFGRQGEYQKGYVKFHTHAL